MKHGIGSLKGALNTHDADVHNITINEFMHIDTGTITALEVAVAIDDYVLNVTSTASFSAGNEIKIKDAVNKISFLARIITVVSATELELDRRVDMGFAIGTQVEKILIEMAGITTATMANPSIFKLKPKPNEIMHLTRILPVLIHGTAGDLVKFGDVVPLVHGMQLRAKIDGAFGTFTNWKTNGDMKTDMFDVDFDVRASGGSEYGTSGRGSFNKLGAVVRLDGAKGDELLMYVTQNIGVTSCRINAQGHMERG